MQGVLFSIFGGVLICLQGVFISRISDKTGLWETNTLVHLAGLILTTIFLFFQGDGNISKITQVNLLYLPGLFLGTLIIFCVIRGISTLGPTWATIILLITQLIVATLIDGWGLFGTPPVKFDMTKLAGLGIIVAGIIVFKIKDF